MAKLQPYERSLKLLSFEIPGLFYYFFYFNEIIEVVNATSPLVASMALMLASLIIGYFFYLFMTLGIRLSFKFIRHYETYHYEAPMEQSFQTLEKLFPNQNRYKIVRLIEKKYKNSFYNEECFMLDFNKGLLFVFCSQFFNYMTQLNNFTSVIYLLLCIIAASICSFQIYKHDGIVKEQYINMYLNEQRDIIAKQLEDIIIKAFESRNKDDQNNRES